MGKMSKTNDKWSEVLIVCYQSLNNVIIWDDDAR